MHLPTIVDKTNVTPLQSPHSILINPLSPHSMLINERLTLWEAEFSTKKPTIATVQHWNGELREQWEYKSRFFGVTLDFVGECGFSILTLNWQMPPGIYFIHFHIYRSSHQEVFFKERVLRIFAQFKRKYPCKSVTSTLLKSHFCMGILL